MRESVRAVGQRFMVGFDGHTASPDVKHLIRELGVGHVILFARNVAEPEQVADLVRELQSVAREARHDLPLLVAVDQEGGRVARLREPWTLWPPQRAIGRAGSEDLARRMGAALAFELKACGIRCDFAPVVDVDSNPKNPIIGDRSFGDDPDLVGRLGAAVVQGLQQGGVAACAKHFPGHGDTDVDSHLALPVVEHSRSRLEEVELPPFRKAIEAGVATIMTAHVVVRELDPDVPATLSPAIIDGLLRKQLGFEGVIVSDDLEMRAVAAHWKPGDAAVRAVRAGCDILPVCASADAQVEAIEGVVRAVESEELRFTEMDAAGLRIRALKQRFLLPYADPDPREARRAAGGEERIVLAREIASGGGLTA
ncbi:MAG TPA: beta-N-acetylhexosaminidase [Vicinamibacteria bacterium]|nr:beta-N-acetylhexosaminidase [Vicinamibacteria bacterium]